MASSDPQPQATPRQVHRPPLRQLAMAVGVTGLAVVGCPSIFLIMIGALRVVIALAGTYAVLAAYFLWLSFQIRVVTSADGIEYHQVGYHIMTTWDNVQGIETLQAGAIRREGLWLHEPAMQTAWWYRWIARQDPDIRGRFIPLTPLYAGWRQSPLGHAIWQHLPHLMNVGTNANDPDMVQLSEENVS